jgi:hypothetical protein
MYSNPTFNNISYKSLGSICLYLFCICYMYMYVFSVPLYMVYENKDDWLIKQTLIWNYVTLTLLDLNQQISINEYKLSHDYHWLFFHKLIVICSVFYCIFHIFLILCSLYQRFLLNVLYTHVILHDFVVILLKICIHFLCCSCNFFIYFLFKYFTIKCIFCFFT